jgi:hypothetical protein
MQKCQKAIGKAASHIRRDAEKKPAAKVHSNKTATVGSCVRRAREGVSANVPDWLEYLKINQRCPKR